MTINAFLLCLGDSVKLDYTIEEEKTSYSYSMTLGSGEAIAINSDVKGFSYAVAEVKAGTKPKDLVLRDNGTLLLTVENQGAFTLSSRLRAL